MKRLGTDLARRLMLGSRAAALLAVAVLAGAVGGAWAVAGAPGLDRVTVLTVADDSPNDSASSPPASAAETSKAPTATKSPKPAKTGKPDDAGKPDGAGKQGSGAQGVHGRCVSKVARGDATGGPNDNHGGAVSAAARNCPRPSPAATDAD